MTDAAPQPSPPPRSHGLVVLALAVVLFMAALDQTVVATALPRITADLGGLEWYAWVFTAYMLATTAAVPVAGKLGDIYGRRRMLVFGVVEFVLSSGLAGLSPSMEVLIAMRALQGVGAGVLAANAQAALGDLFPPAQLAKYNGMMSGVYALSSVVGPVLGGAITDWIGWRWVFLVNLPVGALALVVVLAQFRPRAPAPDQREALDFAGATLLVLAVVAALACLSGLAQLDAAGPWPTVATGVAALVFGALFVRAERRAAAPIVPLRLLGQRELRVLLGMTLLTGLAVYSSAIYTPLMLQGALAMSPSAAGLAMTPMVFALVAGAVLGGVTISRRGRYRAVVALGMTVASAAAAALAWHATTPTVLGVSLALACMGLGVGLSIPALMSAAQNAVAHAELGLVTSLSKFARTFGGIVGLGVLGALVQFRLVATLRAGLSERLGATLDATLDDGLAATLARDPGAMLEGDVAELAALLPEGARPEQAQELLALLREALAGATADLLWAVAACLLLCTLWTARLSDRELRRDFGPDLDHEDQT